jgi:hypothetical protein
LYSTDLSRAKDKLAEILLRPPENMVFASLEIGSPAFENIVGISVEELLLNGKPTGEMGLTVSLSKKIPKDQISQAFLVPRTFEGFKVQTEVTGTVFAQEYNRCYNPVDGGSSIGHVKVTAGTFGCLVKDANDKRFILSNNHILANSNDAHKGDFILQPGRVDGGSHENPSHTNTDCNEKDKCIALLEDFEPLNLDGNNTIDAAIASPIPRSRPIESRIKVIGDVYGSMPAQAKMEVMKSGRTTEFTEGIIASIDADVNVFYHGVGYAYFKNQIKIRGKNNSVFSLGGDSGSLIVSKDKKGVGLLFSGTGDGRTTWANHINNVLNRFNVSIV